MDDSCAKESSAREAFQALPFHVADVLPVCQTWTGPEAMRERLESLSQELYDMIFKEVFTAKEHTHIINNDYKPPVQLQLNRSTRAAFGESYYSKDSKWVFDNLDSLHYFLPAWYTSLPQVAIERLKSGYRPGKCDEHVGLDRNKWVLDCHEWANVYLEKKTGTRKPHTVLHVVLAP